MNLMQAGVEELTQAIVRDLQIEHVDVLQAVEVVEVVAQGNTDSIWCECIDDDELESQEDAIADSPNPGLAKRAYSKKPTLFYVKVEKEEEPNKKLRASLMTKEDIKVAKQMSNAKEI